MTLVNEAREDAQKLLKIRHNGKVKEHTYEPYVSYRNNGEVLYVPLSSAQNINTDAIIEFVDLPRG